MHGLKCFKLSQSGSDISFEKVRQNSPTAIRFVAVLQFRMQMKKIKLRSKRAKYFPISSIIQGFAKTLMRQQQQNRDTSQISVHTDLDSSTASSRVGASRIWEMSDGWEICSYV